MAQPTDANFTGLFEELSARSLAEQVRTAQRYRDLLQQVAAGDLDATALRAEHDRLLADHQAQLARDITELGVRYYQSILDLNRAYVDRLFDQLAAAARTTRREQEPGAAEPEPAPAPAALAVALRGRPGQRVEAGFAVENNHDEVAEVVFYASEFTGERGEVFRVPLELDPPRILLAPHTEHPVTLAVELDPERFLPGSRYRAQVLVRGGEQLELHITIEVEPDEDEAEAEAEEPAGE